MRSSLGALAPLVALPSSLGFAFTHGVPFDGLRRGRIAPQDTRSTSRFDKASLAPPVPRMSGGPVRLPADLWRPYRRRARCRWLSLLSLFGVAAWSPA